MTSSELAPGWTLVVEESTANHWIGSCRDVVMVFAYAGSHDDVSHVHTAMRVMNRTHAETKSTVKLLFVLTPELGKAPDARVRNALLQNAPRPETVSRAAVVVAGTGFGAAIQRGAVAGVIAMMRPKVTTKVWSTVREGFTFLVGNDCVALEALVTTGEAQLKH